METIVGTIRTTGTMKVVFKSRTVGHIMFHATKETGEFVKALLGGVQGLKVSSRSNDKGYSYDIFVADFLNFDDVITLVEEIEKAVNRNAAKELPTPPQRKRNITIVERLSNINVLYLDIYGQHLVELLKPFGTLEEINSKCMGATYCLQVLSNFDLDEVVAYIEALGKR